MSVKHAIYDVAQFKALPDDEADKGRFEALVSVFGNVDKIGDRVIKGAFGDSLAEWRTKGAPIPIIWNHQWGDPNAHIGSADPNEVTETDEGLKVAGKMDLDNPFAAQVYRLLKEQRVKEFSFGYEVRKERRAKDGANELVTLDLIETGPTLRGVNPSTELMAVKAELEAAHEKAGRRISRATESEIRAALEDTERLSQRLSSLLATAGEDDDSDDEKAVEENAEIVNEKSEDGNAELSDEHLDLVSQLAVLKQKGQQ